MASVQIMRILSCFKVAMDLCKASKNMMSTITHCKMHFHIYR